MTIQYRYDPDVDVLFVNMSGEVTDLDLIDYAEKILSEELEDQNDDFIDLTDVTTVSVTGRGLRKTVGVLERGGRASNPGRVAVVAPSDVTFGMARMLQAFRSESPIEVRVFRVASEAREWMGLGD